MSAPLLLLILFIITVTFSFYIITREPARAVSYGEKQLTRGRDHFFYHCFTPRVSRGVRVANRIRHISHKRAPPPTNLGGRELNGVDRARWIVDVLPHEAANLVEVLRPAFLLTSARAGDNNSERSKQNFKDKMSRCVCLVGAGFHSPNKLGTRPYLVVERR